MIKADGDYSSQNVLGENDLVEKISFLKKKNKTIGLCVGSFDLLHPGHVAHFISAKKYCDILVVGVTSDKFVSKRKEGRPIFNERMRTFFISQIKPVDYVFISDYLSANEAIALVKPDFYIKGPDYENKNDEEINSERDSIKSVGGKIVYTNDEKLSATNIIEYIRKLED
jgi:rfaE bifunctional protein nucleotidyltransferase chain/domain